VGRAPARGARLLAPAKLNLGLRIVGRRPDGLHELESVFAPLDLTDELALAVEPGRRAEVLLRVSGSAGGVPSDARNLAFRAAQSFLDAAGLEARVRIALRKRVPAAAGLGGGSSDAGAVLRALAARFPEAVAGERLVELALRLGADVPFFLDPRPALVTGVGERREPLPGRLPALPVLLANPGAPLATAEVFAAAAARAPERAAADPVAKLWREALAGPAEALASRIGPLLANDLEPAAEALCPALAKLRAELRAAGAPAVGLSGSGATLYGVFESPESAAAALRRLRAPAGAWLRLARTLEAG
jgi:4-diphosphocytidyl-2-C-methyl-D-erythritol kinase